MAKTIRVGLIGFKFMGTAHSNAWRQVQRFFDLPVEIEMRALCGPRSEAAGARAAARKLGWGDVDLDYKKFVQRDDLDVIDICTDNFMHAPMGIAAARAGKHVLCEKPLATSLAEAKRMLAAAQKARIVHGLSHNYRGAPAVAFARELIDKGLIGKVYHWRAVYLQDWIMDPNFPLVWRLQKSRAGSGSHGDLNAHIIDLARYLVGEISEVNGLMETFIKERPLLSATAGGLGAKAGKKKGRVTVDDAAIFMARFANGAVGTFEATRFAAGRRNYNAFELNGSKGSLVWNLERMNELQYYSAQDPDGRQGFRTINVTDPSHPYVKAWWPSGHIIGWEHTFTHTVYKMVMAVARKKKMSPDWVDGVKNQAVLEAVETSAKSGKWVRVKA
jgi:predicted dehydrogenase